MSQWQFLLDENIDPKVATYLEKEDIVAVHVRDTLGQGADDEDDVLPHARQTNRIVVTSDVKDFGSLPTEKHSGIVLLFDDTLPAYRVASGLIALVDAYPGRDVFPNREELDSWV